MLRNCAEKQDFCNNVTKIAGYPEHHKQGIAQEEEGGPMLGKWASVTISLRQRAFTK